MLTISLPYGANAEQTAKAIETIGHFVGPEIMTGVVAGFSAKRGPVRVMVNGSDETERMPLTAAALEAGREAPPPPPPGAAELDAVGLPWDERIHSGSKAKVADGSWRMKKGLDEATKNGVLAQLRQHYPEPAQEAPPPPSNDVGAIPASLDRRRAAEAPPPPAVNDFGAFMKVVVGLLSAKKITQKDLTEACGMAGVANSAELGKPENAVHIPTVLAFIQALASE